MVRLLQAGNLPGLSKPPGVQAGSFLQLPAVRHPVLARAKPEAERAKPEAEGAEPEAEQAGVEPETELDGGVAVVRAAERGIEGAHAALLTVEEWAKDAPAAGVRQACRAVVLGLRQPRIAVPAVVKEEPIVKNTWPPCSAGNLPMS